MAAFPADGPTRSVSAAVEHAAVGECFDLLVQLAVSKTTWQVLSQAGAMERICGLADEWTGCMPSEAFEYYLPAFMVRSIHPRTAFEENLRGALIEYLEPGKYASARQISIANSLYCSLTKEQVAAVDRYLGEARDGDA